MTIILIYLKPTRDVTVGRARGVSTAAFGGLVEHGAVYLRAYGRTSGGGSMRRRIRERGRRVAGGREGGGGRSAGARDEGNQGNGGRAARAVPAGHGAAACCT